MNANADPRLTAYALGELDPAERETFERDLAGSPELQAELTAITQLSDHLVNTLADPKDTLTAAQRENLRAHAATPKTAGRRPPFLPTILGALAASIALILGLWTLNQPASKAPDEFPLVVSAAVSNANPQPATPVPASAENAEIRRQLLEGQAFFERGSFDLAARRSERVLALDRSNVPARELLAKVDAARQSFDKEVANATRRQPLAQVTKGWELPVRRDGQKKVETNTPATATAASLAAPKPADLMTAPSVTVRSGQTATVQLATGFAQPVGSSDLAGNDAAFGNGAAAPASAASPSVGGVVALREEEKDLRPAKRFADASAGAPMTIVVDEIGAGTASFPAAASAPSAQPFVGGPIPAVSPAAPANESYAAAPANLFQPAATVPLSTFSIDVDTASYSNVRRFLNDGQLPPPDAVRLEELINYFPYALPAPAADAPFSITTEVSRAPWNPDHLLARIALKGRDIAADKLPASNLVFLVDVSGSMRPENKLPLLKRSLRGLVQRLTPRDRVAIVTYAGRSGLALPSTSGEDQPRILAAIDRLESGGSTNGAEGIQLAYQTAREHFAKAGNNRVILCTDGDFNVGVTSQEALTGLIERERKSGVFLSVLGFGTGNVKDSTMENLADRGNGNYAYIDSPAEGRKVLVEQMGATLFTIAKDVKIQVEFNPATVAGYRLIGYENRLLAKEDFNDDTKDAGEIGAGHAVTALYEIVPAGQPLPNDRSVDPLKYQTTGPSDEIKTRNAVRYSSADLLTVKLRYKAPDSDRSQLLAKEVGPSPASFDEATPDFRFAAAVAAFGMSLRAGPSDVAMDWDAIQKIARGSLGEDPGTYRAEFLTLVEKATQLSRPAGD